MLSVLLLGMEIFYKFNMLYIKVLANAGFKSGDIKVKEKERPGQPKKFEDS